MSQRIAIQLTFHNSSSKMRALVTSSLGWGDRDNHYVQFVLDKLPTMVTICYSDVDLSPSYVLRLASLPL